MGFISWTIRGGDSSMNEMLGYRAAELAAA